MFECASASRRSLLVFLPLVRGGDGTEQLSESRSLAELEKEQRASSLTAGEASDGEASETTRPSAVATDGEATTTVSGGVGSGRLSPVGGSSLTAVASGSWASSSYNTSKLFLFSRVASAE